MHRERVGAVLPAVAGEVDEELVGEVDVDRAGAPALFDQGTGCRPAYLFGGEPPLPESDGALRPAPYRDGTPDPRPPLPVVEGGGAGETKVFLKEVPGSGSLAFHDMFREA